MSSIDVPAVYVVAFDGGEDQYFPGSWTQDNRPTKEEALDKIKKFEKKRDEIVEFWESIPDFLLDTESLEKNIPWWVVTPFYIAPYLAEVLIEVDPADRIQD
jgi:hypothetical protein